MLRILVDFGRLLLLVLFLPLFIIFIGPLLILAVFRGRQPAGPITLNMSRYGLFGRLSAFILGVLIWIVIWSGLAWLALAVTGPAPLATGVAYLTSITNTFGPSSTPTTLAPITPTSPLPAGQSVTTATSLPARPAATVTPLPPALPTATPTPTVSSSLSATAEPVAETASPSVESSPPPARTGTPTLTATPLISDAVTPTPTTLRPTPTLTSRATVTATPAATVTGTAAPAGGSSSTGQETLAAITSVEAGNLLLREAIALADEENLQNLEIVWQGRALTVARNFASDVYERYAKPFSVDFDYISEPTIRSRGADEVVVVSRETWRYEGPEAVEEEAFEFSYTLTRQEDGWVITSYTYRNLPATATLTVTPSSGPATPTPLATSAP